MKLGGAVARGGREYLQLKSYKSRHQYSGAVTYHMTNLIRNSPEISEFTLYIVEQ
ncbi:hypothetical protein JYU34_016778 [Plutella xylostella]|uniref:Uncharacterized protein n=1 Tax=Plutella xylostella TaxID=51655 RepID=A0ABQ7Q767_PLUXY|nr:hypothetical protein JYU34_016778 [Plutella xylostella]